MLYYMLYYMLFYSVCTQYILSQTICFIRCKIWYVYSICSIIFKLICFINCMLHCLLQYRLNNCSLWLWKQQSPSYILFYIKHLPSHLYVTQLLNSRLSCIFKFSVFQWDAWTMIELSCPSLLPYLVTNKMIKGEPSKSAPLHLDCMKQIYSFNSSSLW